MIFRRYIQISFTEGSKIFGSIYLLKNRNFKGIWTNTPPPTPTLTTPNRSALECHPPTLIHSQYNVTSYAYYMHVIYIATSTVWLLYNGQTAIIILEYGDLHLNAAMACLLPSIPTTTVRCLSAMLFFVGFD